MKKSELINHIISLWKSHNYKKATDIMRKYGITDREFASALLHSMRESSEMEKVEDKIGGRIIRAIQEPISTSPKPDIGGTVTESQKSAKHISNKLKVVHHGK